MTSARSIPSVETSFEPGYDPASANGGGTWAVGTPTPQDEGLFRPGSYPSIREYLRATWQRRELIMVLSRARVDSKNAGNRLGQIWLFLDPLLHIGVYFLVFGIGMKAGKDINGFLTWLFVGQVFYRFSQRSIMGCAQSIDSNRGLMGGFAFPRLALPASANVFSMQLFFYSLLPMALSMLVQGFYPRPRWLLLPVLIFVQLCFNFGVGSLLARLGERYPDLVPFMSQFFRLMFYMSMIIFPASRFAEADVGTLGHFMFKLLPLNPFYCFVHIARWLLVDYESPDFGRILLSAGVWTVVSLIIGVNAFFRAEARFGAARIARS